jgi:predicted PurR-regulated permease PerM
MTHVESRAGASPARGAARARSQVSPRTVWTVGLNVLLMLAVLAVLHGALEVIGWILVALFLALALDPAVRFIEAHRVPRTAAVLIVIATALGLVALLLATLVPMLIDQGRGFVHAFPALVEKLRETRLGHWADQRIDVLGRLQQELSTRAGEAAGPVVAIVGSALRAVAATVTVVVLSAFMLLFGGSLFESLLGWIPAGHRERVVAVTARMRRSVGGYVSGTLLIASIGGVVTGITLLALGVPYFLPLGLAMTLLGVVPFLGATLGGLLVVTTTFLTTGTQQGLIALAIYAVYQQTENHLLQPLVQRRTIQMNPLAIALVMLVGTAFAGVLGALLALPVAAATHILLEELTSQRRRRAGEPTSEPVPTPAPAPAPKREPAPHAT